MPVFPYTGSPSFYIFIKVDMKIRGHNLSPLKVMASYFLCKNIFCAQRVFHPNFFLYNKKQLKYRISEFELSHSEASGIRTPDNLIKSQVLYQLS